MKSRTGKWIPEKKGHRDGTLASFVKFCPTYAPTDVPTRTNGLDDGRGEGRGGRPPDQFRFRFVCAPARARPCPLTNAVKVKGRRPSCSGQLNPAYGGRERGICRSLGGEKEAEGQRALRAKPWKLPSELVVSAISSVAAIFMAAIPRLPGVSAPRSQDKCLRQNEPQ